MTAPRTFRYRDAAGKTLVFSGSELAAAVSVGVVPKDARVEVEGNEGWIAVQDALAMSADAAPSSAVSTPRGPAPPTPRMPGAPAPKIVKPVATANITPPTVPPPRSHKPTTLGLSDDVIIPKAPRAFQVPLPPGATPAPPAPASKKGQTFVMEPVAAPQAPPGPHGTRPMQPYAPPAPKVAPNIPAPRATEVMPLGIDAPPPVGAPAPPPRIPTIAPPMGLAPPPPSVRPPPPSVRGAPPPSFQAPPPAAFEQAAAPPSAAESFQPPVPTHQGSTPPPPPSARPGPMAPPARPLALASSKPTMPMQAFVPQAVPPSIEPVAEPLSASPPVDEPRTSLPPPDLEAAARRRKSFVPIVGAALGAAVLLVIVGVVVSALRKPSDVPVAPAASAAPAPAKSDTPPVAAASSAPVAPVAPAKPAEGGLGACTVAKAAVKLAPRASKDIPLELAGIPATSRIALGYSIDGKTPYGVEVDPATLGVKKGTVPRATGTFRRVFAMPVSSGAKWIVDADPKKASLRLAQTVAVEPTFVVGVAGDVVATADKVTDAWAPGPRIKGNADLLRSLVVPGAGVIVAVRAGDVLSAVRLGADKAAKGDLVPLADAGQAGTPSLGTNGVEVAVAFAHRDAASAPWGIKISRFLKDDAPAKAAAFAVPAGGPGGDAFAPSVAGLADGRWLLSWTEGATGSRVVRIATLSATGELLGEPLALSVAKSNAGQPSLAVVGADALAVYLASPKKGTYEIWGATLSCR